MTDLNSVYDCAVIDEAQLLGDGNRGWAWTRALLGLQAQDIHVCGAPSCVDIIQRLAAATGDEVEVHEYRRYSKLEVSSQVVGSLKELRDGDCLVAFSRRKLYKLKSAIDRTTNHRCCIIYGGLPPEARRERARLFNTGGTTEFL